MAEDIASVTEILRMMREGAAKSEDIGRGVADAKFAEAHTTHFAAQEFAPASDASGETIQSLAEKLQAQRLYSELTRQVSDAARFTGVDSILVGASQKMAAALQEAITASEQIDQIESMSFMDNPMGWLKNKVSPDPAYAAYEAAANKFNLISQGVVATSNVLQEVATTNAATRQPLSVAAEKSVIQAFEKKLALEKASIQARAHALDADALKAVLNASMDGLNTLQEGQRMAMSRRSLALQEANEAEKDIAKKGEEHFAEIISLGYKSFHGVDAPPATIDDFKMMFKMGQPLKEEYARYYQRGSQVISMDPNDPAITSYGFSPAEAFANIRTLRINLQGPAKNTYKNLEAVYTALASNPEYVKLKTQPERDAFMNAEVARWVASKTRLLDDKDGSNPFLLPPLKVYDDPSVKGAQIVKGTNLWKKVFAHAVKEGKYNKLDHQQIFDAVAQAVEEKKITALEAASELQVIVAFGTFVNHVGKLHNKFGIDQPKDYMVQIELPPKTFEQAVTTAQNVAPGMAVLNYFDGQTPESMLVNLNSTNSIKEALLKYNSNALMRVFKPNPTTKREGIK